MWKIKTLGLLYINIGSAIYIPVKIIDTGNHLEKSKHMYVYRFACGCPFVH